MSRYAIHHRTHYRYARAVELGVHRLMVRPKDSHDLRLEDATLTLSPHADVRWSHDVFGNSVAKVTFATATDELLIESRLEVSRYSLGDSAIEIDDTACLYPFVYAPDDRINLGPFLTCNYGHCATAVMAWAQSYVAQGMQTLDLLRTLNAAIRSDFAYFARPMAGVQAPSETLALRSGTCRDFATLFIEAARALGIGARFVTGYLYDPALDKGDNQGMVGAGATHAWAEVYLPGPGWVEFDPTNALIESPSLLRVGVSTDAEHAVPINGSYMGFPADVVDVDIEVKVTALPPKPPLAEPAAPVVESAATPPLQASAAPDIETEEMQQEGGGDNSGLPPTVHRAAA
ncbi:MAG: transglutaminase family protein [Alphaproteobacteria bacterium]|nr:transglutaminase family protein [Alphaproteobacteria bacterium]